MANEQSGVFMEDGYVLRQPPYNDFAKFNLINDYIHAGTVWEPLSPLEISDNTLGLELQIDNASLLVPFAGNYLISLLVNWYDIPNTTVLSASIAIDGSRKIIKQHLYFKFGAPAANFSSHFIYIQSQMEKDGIIQAQVRSNAAGRKIINDAKRTFLKIELLSKNEATP